MGDRGGAKRTAAAALIFHHNGAEQRLDPVRPGSPDGVESAARRKRNDQADRPFGRSRPTVHELRAPPLQASVNPAVAWQLVPPCPVFAEVKNEIVALRGKVQQCWEDEMLWPMIS